MVKTAHHFFITICVASGSGEMEVLMTRSLWQIFNLFVVVGVISYFFYTLSTLKQILVKIEGIEKHLKISQSRD